MAFVVSQDRLRALSHLEPIRGSGICVRMDPSPNASSVWCSVSVRLLKQEDNSLIALPGTSGKGLTVIGKLAKKYLKGDLVAVKDPKNEYVIKGDVTVNNTIVLKNQTIIMDVGTDNIQG